MAEELDAIDAYRKKKVRKENLKVLVKKSQIVLNQEKQI